MSDNKQKTIYCRPGRKNIAEIILIAIIIIGISMAVIINYREFNLYTLFFIAVIMSGCIIYDINYFLMYKNLRIKVYKNSIEYTDKYKRIKHYRIEDIDYIKQAGARGVNAKTYHFNSVKDKLTVNNLYIGGSDFNDYIFMYRWDNGLDSRKWKK